MMRNRGIAIMRRGAGGRFSPAGGHRRSDNASVPSHEVWLVAGLSGVATDQGHGIYLMPGNDLQRSKRGRCMSVDEEAVRQLAQLIWETEGRPEGQEARHWDMATKLAESAAMAPVRAPNRHKIDTLFPAPDEDPDLQ